MVEKCLWYKRFLAKEMVVVGDLKFRRKEGDVAWSKRELEAVDGELVVQGRRKKIVCGWEGRKEKKKEKKRRKRKRRKKVTWGKKDRKIMEKKNCCEK